MKKYFMIAAAALLIASCAKESDEMYEGIAQSGEVTFSAFARNAMKSYVVNTGFYDLDFKKLRDDASGEVRESLEKDASSDASGNPVPTASYDAIRAMQLSVYNEKGECDLFVDEKYAREKDGQWHATPHKFYPIGYENFDFLAYSVREKSFENVSWNGAKEVKLEVTENFLTDDILYAGGKQNATAHAPAQMTFNHAQAWITVRFTADYGDASSDACCLNASGDPLDASGNAILSIDEAVWQNIYKSGELTIKYDEAETNNANATWNFFTQETSNVAMPDRDDNKWAASGDAATYGYPVATEAKLVKNSYLDMLVPQQAKKELVINYTLGKDKAGNDQKFSYTVDLDKIKGSSGDNWEMGKHYIYNIKFYITEITTAPSVEVWATQTAIGIDL